MLNTIKAARALNRGVVIKMRLKEQTNNPPFCNYFYFFNLALFYFYFPICGLFLDMTGHSPPNINVLNQLCTETTNLDYHFSSYTTSRNFHPVHFKSEVRLSSFVSCMLASMAESMVWCMLWCMFVSMRIWVLEK